MNYSNNNKILNKNDFWNNDYIIDNDDIDLINSKNNNDINLDDLIFDDLIFSNSSDKSKFLL